MGRTKLPTKYSKEDIKTLLTTNDKAVVHGIKVLYTYQTQSEQRTGETHEFNNVGFSGCDSKILSSFAVQLNKGWFLSEKQMKIAREKIMKYAGQLAKIANEKWRREQGIAC